MSSYLTAVPVFNTGYEPDNERLTNGEVNVLTYGATPNNGGEDDDTTAFLNAINAALRGDPSVVDDPRVANYLSHTRKTDPDDPKAPPSISTRSYGFN